MLFEWVQPFEGPPSEVNYGVDLRLLAEILNTVEGTVIHKLPGEAD